MESVLQWPKRCLARGLCSSLILYILRNSVAHKHNTSSGLFGIPYWHDCDCYPKSWTHIQSISDSDVTIWLQWAQAAARPESWTQNSDFHARWRHNYNAIFFLLQSARVYGKNGHFEPPVCALGNEIRIKKVSSQSPDFPDLPLNYADKQRHYQIWQNHAQLTRPDFRKSKSQVSRKKVSQSSFNCIINANQTCMYKKVLLCKMLTKLSFKSTHCTESAIATKIEFHCVTSHHKEFWDALACKISCEGRLDFFSPAPLCVTCPHYTELCVSNRTFCHVTLFCTKFHNKMDKVRLKSLANVKELFSRYMDLSINSWSTLY